MYGETQLEHDTAVKNVMKMLEANNLTPNESKSEFNKSQITYFGLIFSGEGVKPDPEKVVALRGAEPPGSKSQLRSFLVMVSFSADYIKQFTELTVELRTPMRENV